MRVFRSILVAGCALALAGGASLAGINSKEVGALLVYPEYLATDGFQTYITVTNNKSTAVNAHVEIIGANQCSDCNFDLPLTGFQTKRLKLSFNFAAGFGTLVEDASEISTTPPPLKIITACPEAFGFVIVSLEAAKDETGAPAEPRRTLGENMLHGDEVVVTVTTGEAVQVGAIAVQGVGPNNGDREFRFDNMEYAAFPSIITADFWSPNTVVSPFLVLFNVNFRTGETPPPTTSCSINFVDAEEHKFSRNHNFGCWNVQRIDIIAPGAAEAVLGTANGYLWAQCEAGTHGALWTFLGDNPAPAKYPHAGGQFKDTLFQSVTTNPAAVLHLTPDVTGG